VFPRRLCRALSEASGGRTRVFVERDMVVEVPSQRWVSLSSMMLAFS
jgi:hypothetical protein